jgi:carboxymethylenebutenolidase
MPGPLTAPRTPDRPAGSVCHEPGSRPPAAPRSGDVAERGRPPLTAADGNRFSAACAAPPGTAAAGVVILPDARGLHGYYAALTER